MPRIHFLNVKEGDCSIIEHSTGHTTMIDVCNAKPADAVSDRIDRVVAYDDKKRQGVFGNFQQKNFPVNPISYMNNHGITTLFRYIQTHPDMDHMDGIEALFNGFSPTNFWDIDNMKEMQDSNWLGSHYRKSDWEFYKNLRDTNPRMNPKRMTPYSSVCSQYHKQETDVRESIDGLQVLAPTKELVIEANETDRDYNSCSYVILYATTMGGKVVFSGDSHDKTWDHVLKHHKDEVTNIDLLIAPHHGRKSDRSYNFLDTLKPTLTFFGNAPLEYLAYDAWSNRGLSIVTNNQANCMIVDDSTSPMTLYVTYENFARSVNTYTYHSNSFQAWYVGHITEDLIP